MTHSSAVALIFTPLGRDASIASAILAEAGMASAITPSLPSFVDGLRTGAAFAIVTEEALRNGDLREVADFIAGQAEWSDFPIILLTERGGGPERNPAAGRMIDALGNVTFLERPFHPTTLVSLCRSALRARRRQYDARASLESVRQSAAAQKVAQRELANLAATLEDRVTAATAELKASQARLRSIFETSYQYQGEMTPEGILLDANATSLAGIGKRRDEVIGQPFWTTPWFSETPGMPETVREAVSRVAAGETIRQEITVKLPAGLRTFDFSMHPVRGEGGRIVALLPEAVDITERRIAEENLLQSQKLETIGQLTGGVAHDFNNLLTPIVGSIDLLRRKLMHDERAQALASAGLQSAERAKVLVNRLLAFARRQSLEPRPVNIEALVEGMRDLIERSIGPTIAVEVDLRRGLPAAQVDPNQLELSILNLCVNARDAMPGGGRITIAASLDIVGYALPGALKPGAYIRLSVADTGVGMDAATAKRAVEPFYTTKDVGRGTGLGLSMVHGLMAQLGGGMAIESEPGHGTSVTLWLPALEGPAAAPPSPTRPPTRSRPRPPASCWSTTSPWCGSPPPTCCATPAMRWWRRRAPPKPTSASAPA